MKQVATQGIVLARINYGEADRIITVLTTDQGKIRLLAKGVRRIKSKMAGGIELFSVTDITYIRGKGDMGTLISSRLQKNFGHIVTDINRTMFAYDVLKQINKITEDSPEPEYYQLLRATLAGLQNADLSLAVIGLWLQVRLLTLGGHALNLDCDTEGNLLVQGTSYGFNLDDMAFQVQANGRYGSQHIKLLRLCQSRDEVIALAQVQGAEKAAADVNILLRSIMQQVG